MPSKATASSGSFKVSVTGSLNRPLSRKERLVRKKAEKAARKRKPKAEKVQHQREDPVPLDAASPDPEPAAREEGEQDQREAHVPPGTHTISDSEEDQVAQENLDEGNRTNRNLMSQFPKYIHVPLDRSDAESFRDADVSDGSDAADTDAAVSDDEDDAAADAAKPVEGHHTKKPPQDRGNTDGKLPTDTITAQPRQFSIPSSFTGIIEQGNAGGAGPSHDQEGDIGRSPGETTPSTNCAATRGGEGKLQVKPVTPSREGASRGKTLKELPNLPAFYPTERKDPVISLDSPAIAGSTKEIKGSLTPPHRLTYTTYLPETCPTPDATATEEELWKQEIRGLRPYLESKHAAAPDHKRLLLVNAEIDKAAKNIVPRFWLEIQALDATAEARSTLDEILEDLNKAKQREEEDEDLLDRIQGRITAAKESMKSIRALAQALSAVRYRLPDPEHQALTKLETEYNTAVEAISRLRGAPSATSKGKTQYVPAEQSVRSMNVFHYITAAFSGEGDNPKKDFAQWRAEWRDAERYLKSRKASASDYFNRLQPALEGQALALAQEYRDRSDPYRAAMKRLGKDYGDDIKLALEYLRPIQNPAKAVEAARNAWDRFQKMETPLGKKGLQLQDLLWHQTVLRILPPSLEPQKRWEQWVEVQKRSFSQRQAGKDRPEGEFLNLEKKILTGSRDPVLPLATPAKTGFTKEVKGSPTTALTYRLLTSSPLFPEFEVAACYREPEVARFLEEIEEDWKKDLPTPTTSSAQDVAFHANEEKGEAGRQKTLHGCLKCGRASAHTTDRCSRVGSMSEEAWRTLAGPNCQKCGLHRYRKGFRCTYKCPSCGGGHMACRHRSGRQEKPKREEGPTKEQPPQKRARKEGPAPSYAATAPPPAPYPSAPSYPPPPYPTYPAYPPPHYPYPPPPPPQQPPAQQEETGQRKRQKKDKKKQGKKAGAGPPPTKKEKD